MPNIILKKTFKIKPSGFKVAAEKSLTFHGGISEEMIQNINNMLSTLKLFGRSNQLVFRMDSAGHYHANMNHDFQKYHEEDAVVAIMDVMELLGWIFRFQYDSTSQSVKVTGSSFTAREIFIFHRT